MINEVLHSVYVLHVSVPKAAHWYILQLLQSCFTTLSCVLCSFMAEFKSDPRQQLQQSISPGVDECKSQGLTSMYEHSSVP